MVSSQWMSPYSVEAGFESLRVREGGVGRDRCPKEIKLHGKLRYTRACARRAQCFSTCLSDTDLLETRGHSPTVRRASRATLGSGSTRPPRGIPPCCPDRLLLSSSPPPSSSP